MVSFTVKDAAGTVRRCVVDEDAEHVVQGALVQLFGPAPLTIMVVHLDHLESLNRKAA